MLQLILPPTDGLEPLQIHLEHSLVSLSKWEAIYEKPFFSRDDKTEKETETYIKQMLLDKDVPPNFVERFRPEHYSLVGNYINSKQTATTFREDGNSKGSSEIITAELIYYWLISFSIPFSPVEEWHLNKLMTLIRIAGIKQTKPKPMSKAAQMEQQRHLNAQRRQSLGTSG